MRTAMFALSWALILVDIPISLAGFLGAFKDKQFDKFMLVTCCCMMFASVSLFMGASSLP